MFSIPPVRAAESCNDDPLEACHEEKRNNSTLQDIQDLQDTEFTCRIQAPGTETFDLQVLVLQTLIRRDVAVIWL